MPKIVIRKKTEVMVAPEDGESPPPGGMLAGRVHPSRARAAGSGPRDRSWRRGQSARSRRRGLEERKDVVPEGGPAGRQADDRKNDVRKPKMIEVTPVNRDPPAQIEHVWGGKDVSCDRPRTAPLRC